MTNKRVPLKVATPSAERVFPKNLDSSLGFLISDTARHVKRLLYPGIAQLGIRGGSWYVLRALFEADGVTQRELANRLGTTQPSTLEMLRSMEKEGLVHFQRDTLDRRKLRIYLTDKALKLKTPLLRAAGEANSILLGGLTQAQEILLKTMLGTVRSAAADAIAQFELQSAVKESPTRLHLREEERQAHGNQTDCRRR
ncbi:regulatory protein MarR [Delftia sp. Cs1-4]|nr:regulatory protein MarR [Delftia sp. Cs1-4]